MAPKSKAGSSTMRNTQAQKQRGKTASKPKNGLALVMESPARTLTSFTGFERSPQSKSGNTEASGSVKRDDFKQTSVSGKAKESRPMQESLESKKDDQMWIDRYTPQNKSELAIHKKKIEQVEGWLREALDGSQKIRKYRRLLVLSGPAGSGKSAIVRTLSIIEELNYQIVEWKNDGRQNLQGLSSWDNGRVHAGFDSTLDAGPSQLNRFSAFLSQSSRFNTLHIGQDDSEVEMLSTHTPSKRRDRRIILIDDLPNLQYEPARLEFQAVLEKFVCSPHREDSVPVILILSDTVPRLDDWATSSSMQGWKERNDESLNVRNVLSDSVRTSPTFTQISFNSVAMTFLRKALLAILSTEKQRSIHAVPAPTSVAAKELVDVVASMSNGDIRNAINSLQMALVSSSSGTTLKGSAKRTADGKYKDHKSIARKQAKKISLATGREASLAIFHALGKILYNKRIGDPQDEERNESDSEEEDEGCGSESAWLKSTMNNFLGGPIETSAQPLPAHLQHLERRQSRVDVEKLWRTMPMDAKTLQIFLHQNYTPFCGNIEQCTEFVDNLSYSDILKPQHEEWFHSSLSQYYSFLVATHGSLMSLPSPIQRNDKQRFRGVAFFESNRKLRKTQETLHDVRAAFHEEMASRTIEYSETYDNLSPTLIEVGLEQLAYEVLPLVAKCRELPEELSDSIRFNNLEIGRPFSMNSNLANTSAFQGGMDIDEDDADIALADEEDVFPAVNPLYDEQGRRRKVELLPESESKVARTNSLKLPNLIPLRDSHQRNDVNVKLEDGDGDEYDEDEIEDFD
ncbi:hypothetical protein L7F22_044066 [Adiantum nelumboides]|nr:hypothetical protein [Adiantum nelumboides]